MSCICLGSRPSEVSRFGKAVLFALLPVARDVVKAVIPISESIRHIEHVYPGRGELEPERIRTIFRQSLVSLDGLLVSDLSASSGIVSAFPSVDK